MHALKARVENGRYVIDELADLPEGTEAYWVPANDGDELGEVERSELLESIEEGAEDFAKAEVEDALEFSKRLMAQT